MFLILAYLFYIGSSIGWILEVFYRHYVSNKKTKWVNPGYCVGPYLPIYGIGLIVMYCLAYYGDELQVNKILIFLIMALFMTLIEYIGGIYFLKTSNLRLWDYTNEWGNIDGVICPLYSFFWSVLGAVYYFLIHPHILDSLNWLSQNLAFSFVIGFFFGVFTIDICYSSNIISKLKKFAKERDVVVKTENLKANIQNFQEELQEKRHFFFSYRSKLDLFEDLEKFKEDFERKIKNK